MRGPFVALKTCKNLLLVAALGVSLGQAAVAADQAPDFVLPTSSGKIDLADLKGKVIYLDFWASWCHPCRKSFPWLNEMQERYGQKGLAVVAINVDRTPDLASKFLQNVPANFTVAYDPDGKVADVYQVQGMPSSFLIDRTGHIREVHMGFRENETSLLEEDLQTLLTQ